MGSPTWSVEDSHVEWLSRCAVGYLKDPKLMSKSIQINGTPVLFSVVEDGIYGERSLSAFFQRCNAIMEDEEGGSLSSALPLWEGGSNICSEEMEILGEVEQHWPKKSEDEAGANVGPNASNGGMGMDIIEVCRSLRAIIKESHDEDIASLGSRQAFCVEGTFQLEIVNKLLDFEVFPLAGVGSCSKGVGGSTPKMRIVVSVWRCVLVSFGLGVMELWRVGVLNKELVAPGMNSEVIHGAQLTPQLRIGNSVWRPSLGSPACGALLNVPLVLGLFIPNQVVQSQRTRICRLGRSSHSPSSSVRL
ncbi:hypothetical protein VNO78_19450 [Psophocarpus tetragonolobus]|uniref:Uncharacterized protein n=1 Tax=Psophocarpus tetragonolobus TaxID=3891 RepID=A0AAN9S8M8_PSOTE